MPQANNTNLLAAKIIDITPAIKTQWLEHCAAEGDNAKSFPDFRAAQGFDAQNRQCLNLVFTGESVGEIIPLAKFSQAPEGNRYEIPFPADLHSGDTYNDGQTVAVEVSSGSMTSVRPLMGMTPQGC